MGDPVLTGKPFNDAYRYMNWLLTVPLLLLEIIFCMQLEPEKQTLKAWMLGIACAHDCRRLPRRASHPG